MSQPAPNSVGVDSLENLNMEALLEHYLAPRASADGQKPATTQESIKNTVIKTICGIEGMPAKIVEHVFSKRELVDELANNARIMKKMKTAIEETPPDTLIANKVVDPLDQTVLIVAGGADGIIESDGVVAVLRMLPRWLQIFLLACKQPFDDEQDQLTNENHVRYGHPRSVDFDDASAFSGFFQKLVDENRLNLEELMELAIDECDAERYQREDDDEGEEEDEDEDDEDAQKEYYTNEINEAIDDVAGNSLDCSAIETLVKVMQVYKRQHSVLMSPFLVVRIDHNNIGC